LGDWDGKKRRRGVGGLDWKIKERKRKNRIGEEERKRNVGRGEWERIVDE
jgi:hypothetical protein